MNASLVSSEEGVIGFTYAQLAGLYAMEDLIPILGTLGMPLLKGGLDKNYEYGIFDDISRHIIYFSWRKIDG